jgi:hypothetical protein
VDWCRHRQAALPDKALFCRQPATSEQEVAIDIHEVVRVVYDQRAVVHVAPGYSAQSHAEKLIDTQGQREREHPIMRLFVAPDLDHTPPPVPQVELGAPQPGLGSLPSRGG